MLNIVSGRTPLRRVLRTTVAVALVGGVVAGIGVAPVVAAPERVLQSVSISLGNDSSIRSVSSTAVHATEGDELSSDSTSFDPAEVAEELPVRVLTTYRMGDRAGTDLSEIEGEAGRVVIDVTVQNVTARPERLSYDFNGTQQRTNALVATPLTVVASADLGESGLGSVVTKDDVSPDDVTNGVLGRSGGSGDVQWAALLAPPRLGASATFRLVQETDDFRVPTFDLSVQPGLVTDPSVQHLLEAAFADDPSSTLKLETSTIELVSEVNATLTGATSVLSQIQEALSTSADELGQKTISDLQSSSQLVSSALTGLAGDLDSLNSQMASEMESANADTVAQFRDTVESMKSLLGDPADFENLPTVKSVECGSELPRLKSGSITQQMIAITTQLRTIQGSTDDCKQAITRGLNTAIGTVDDTAADDTVIGTLRKTQAGLQEKVDALNAAKADLEGRFDSTLLGQLGGKVELLQGFVDDVNSLSGNLSGGGAQKVTSELERMKNDLDAMQGQALPALSGTFDEIHASAADELGRLTADGDDAVDQVWSARNSMCALADPGTEGTVDSGGLHDASVLLVGRDCDDDEITAGSALPGGYSQPVVDRTAATQATLTSIVQTSDTSRGTAADALDTLQGKVEGLLTSVVGLLEATDRPTKDEIDELQAAIDELSDGDTPYFGDGAAAWPDLEFEIRPANADLCEAVRAFEIPSVDPASPPLGYVEPDALDVMLLFHKKMQCNQHGIEAAIGHAFNQGVEALTNTRDQLDDDVLGIDRARGAAEGEVDRVVGRLSTALGASVESIRSQGKASVTTQRGQLDKEQARLAASLDQRVRESVGRINDTVSRSTRNLGASEKALLADLDEVLIDLGDRSRSGSGLLGALVKGAADTGTATDSVIRANRAASEFAGVRSAALEDVYLQQAQLSRSLERLEAYPAFGIDLPEGSSHLTVFTFTIGES